MKPGERVRRAMFGRLAVEVHPDAASLHQGAVRDCQAILAAALAERGEARFALDAEHLRPDFLAALRRGGMRPPLAWSQVRIVPFVLRTAPRGGAGASDRLAFEAWRAEVERAPLDLACADVGPDGRLGGNTPRSADFDDARSVQTLDDGGGWTLTLPVLRRARHLIVISSGGDRASVVLALLRDAITSACPAAVIRLHPSATLHLDPAAATLALPRRIDPKRRATT